MFVATDRNEARARRDRNRDQRSRPDVVDPVFDNHVANFEPPQPDECAISVRPGEDPGRWVRQHAALLSDPQAG